MKTNRSKVRYVPGYRILDIDEPTIHAVNSNVLSPESSGLPPTKRYKAACGALVLVPRHNTYFIPVAKNACTSCAAIVEGRDFPDNR